MVAVSLSGLRGQARVRLLEEEHPVEAMAMDELASSSLEQAAAPSFPERSFATFLPLPRTSYSSLCASGLTPSAHKL